MLYVHDLLNQKGTEIWVISPDQSVYEALQLMAEKDVGALLVTKHEKVVGIFSERDYARKVILEQKSSKSTKVADIMSTTLFKVTPDHTIDECMAIMTGKRIRHLPVMHNEQLTGLISIGDVVKAIITKQGVEIKQLEDYINGLLHG